MPGGEMSRRTFCRSLAGGASAALCGQAFAARPIMARPPNVIIIYTDDQGYHDLGCYGARDIPTPGIDRMAREGVRFTDFYSAASVCTPARAGLMTGCYPLRVSMTHVLFPAARIGLHPNELTMAGMLKPAGYKTACIGKWHLGHRQPFLPPRQGFDFFYGMPYSNDMNPSILMQNGEVIERPVRQSTLTQRYTRETIEFIKRNRRQPFFVYLAHSMPHVPLHASSHFRGVSQRGAYGDVIAEIDWSVDMILDTLRTLGLHNDTLVVFTSDNGPWIGKGKRGGSADPLRGGKFSAYEGGFRVPCVMWMPGAIPASSQCSQIASAIDLYPTIARLSGAPLPEYAIDGEDIWHLMTGRSSTSPHEAFCYYGPGGRMRAIRSGDWKLHMQRQELYNLALDISESRNVISRNSDIAGALHATARRIHARIRENKRPHGRIAKLRKAESTG
jgi:arylsulfatase A